MRRPLHFMALAATGAMALLAACGSTSSSSSSGGGGGNADLSGCKGTVTVATDLPTSGSDASDGVPTRNGATLAVQQATANKLLGGCTIAQSDQDDSSPALGKHDPAQGAQNISKLVGDQSVVGVVGPFNSSVATKEMPIANNGGLALISPANTNPGLTISGSNPDIDTNSLRPTGNVTYFRVCTTDIGQAKALQKAATEKLQSKNAYIIDDKETYGKGLADEFQKDFEAAGGKTAKHVSLPGDTKDFTQPLTEAKNANPKVDLVFFGGTSSNGGGIIRSQMKTVGLDPSVNFLGGDGIVDDEFFTQAGAAGDGAYGTIAAPDPTKLQSAQQFVSDYKSKFNDDPGAYSANAYDAMNILLQATKSAIAANGGKLYDDIKAFRSAVIQQLAKTDYNGAIGHTTFDKNGDTSNVLLTLKIGKGQKWTYSDTIQLTKS